MTTAIDHLLANTGVLPAGFETDLKRAIEQDFLAVHTRVRTLEARVAELEGQDTAEALAELEQACEDLREENQRLREIAGSQDNGAVDPGEPPVDDGAVDPGEPPADVETNDAPLPRPEVPE